MSDHTDTIRKLLKDTLRVDTTNLGDADPLFSAGLIDSFALLELITVLESTFGIRISAEQATIDNLDSIEGMAKLVGSGSS